MLRKYYFNWGAHNKKKLSEQFEDCPKTKTRITTSTYGSLADLHIIKEYVNAAGGKVMLDTKYHILKIVENPAPCEYQTIYDVIQLLFCFSGENLFDFPPPHKSCWICEHF